MRPVTLRVATPGDRDFLLDLFASTRSLEFAALPSPQAQQFVQMQFQMQQRSYAACYPAAENKIILLAGEPIGRILIDRSPPHLLLVDIALLPLYRGRGIGSALIEELLNEAGSLNRAVKLSVYLANPALRLYERLGFSKISEEGLYAEMKWSGPDASGRVTKTIEEEKKKHDRTPGV
jgi:ribosomal protein S18 acetylase RimI-like enzyme